MKKEYKKPLIAVESFQLDAAVAASCSSQGFVPIGYGETRCGFDEITDGYYQFFSDIQCELDLTQADGSDTLCYHGPMYSSVTFVQS